MAKFWYLATVIPIPKWFLKPIQKLLFEFLWSGGKDPITRETIFLPIDQGGLGLLNPEIQQRALRLRFLQNIVSSKVLDRLSISGSEASLEFSKSKQLTETRPKYFSRLLW